MQKGEILGRRVRKVREKLKKSCEKSEWNGKCPQGIATEIYVCLHMEILLLLLSPLLCCCFHFCCHYFGWKFHPFARTLPSNYPRMWKSSNIYLKQRKSAHIA